MEPVCVCVSNRARASVFPALELVEIGERTSSHATNRCRCSVLQLLTPDLRPTFEPHLTYDYFLSNSTAVARFLQSSPAHCLFLHASALSMAAAALSSRHVPACCSHAAAESDHSVSAKLLVCTVTLMVPASFSVLTSIRLLRHCCGSTPLYTCIPPLGCPLLSTHKLQIVPCYSYFGNPTIRIIYD